VIINKNVRWWIVSSALIKGSIMIAIPMESN
jgi:hypothetical protein